MYRIRSCQPPPSCKPPPPMYFDRILFKPPPLSKIKEYIGKPPPSCKQPPTTFAHMSAKPPRAAYKSEYGMYQ